MFAALPGTPSKIDVTEPPKSAPEHGSVTDERYLGPYEKGKRHQENKCKALANGRNNTDDIANDHAPNSADTPSRLMMVPMTLSMTSISIVTPPKLWTLFFSPPAL